MNVCYSLFSQNLNRMHPCKDNLRCRKGLRTSELSILGGDETPDQGSSSNTSLLTYSNKGRASRSVSHISYQCQLAGLRSRALLLEDYLSQPSFMSPSPVNGSENSGEGEMALQQQNVESYGEEDLQNNESQGPFPTEKFSQVH